MHNHRISSEEVQSAGRGNVNSPASCNDCTCFPKSEKTHFMLPRVSSNFHSSKLCSNAPQKPTQTIYALITYREFDLIYLIS